MTLSASPLPPSVDWRTKGVVPPVRNQGQCGSSVSFALVGAIDAFHAIRTKQLVLGSEEEFRECCATPPCSCDGEIVSGDAYKCVVEIGGLATEGSYPPPSTSCKCRNDTVAPVIKIDGGRDVSPSRNETALEAAVAMQPVFALIDASHTSFQLYTAGIYNEPSCSQSNLDLAVLIVGYGSEGKEDYWIVQNSWGECGCVCMRGITGARESAGECKRECRGMQERVRGNARESAGECKRECGGMQERVRGNARESAGECKRECGGMQERVRGNARESVGECKGECGGMQERVRGNARESVGECKGKCGGMQERVWGNARESVGECKGKCGGMQGKVRGNARESAGGGERVIDICVLS